MERVVNLYWDPKEKEVIVGCDYESMEIAIQETNPDLPLLNRVWVTIPE
jgi:hypothetical protein